MPSIAYATPEQLYAQPNVTVLDNSDTVNLILLAASIAIDGFCNRQEDGFIASAPKEKQFTSKGLRYLQVNEFIELVSVQVKNTEDLIWTNISLTNIKSFQGSGEFPNFNFLPYNGILITNEIINEFPEAKNYEPTVKITAKWGYALVVPELITQATISLAARWLKRGQSFWSDTAANDNSSSLIYRQPLDPDIKMMLKMSRMVKPTYGE